MAEQFDWSKVLERMREDDGSSRPAAAAPAVEPEVAEAPAPPPAVEAAPPVFELNHVFPVEAEAPAVVEATTEETETPTAGLAWDEDDYVVEPAVKAQALPEDKPTPVAPLLDWDDDDAPSAEPAAIAPETTHFVAEALAPMLEETVELPIAPAIGFVEADEPTSAVEPEPPVLRAPTAEQAWPWPSAGTTEPAVVPAEDTLPSAPVAEYEPPVLEAAECLPPPLPTVEPPTIEADELSSPTMPVAEPEPPVMEAVECLPPPLPAIEAVTPTSTSVVEEPVVGEVASEPMEESIVKAWPELKLLPTAFDNDLVEAAASPNAEVAPAAIEDTKPQEPVAEVTIPPVFDMADFDAMRQARPEPETPVVEVARASEPKAEKKPKASKKAAAPTSEQEEPSVPELKLVKRATTQSFGLSDKRLGSALMDVKAITREQLEDALAQQVDSGEPLGRILVRRGVVSINRVLQVVAIQRGIDAWDLEADPPKGDAAALLAGETCARLAVLPVQVKGDLLVLAMADPDDTAAIEEARAESRMRIQPVLADPERLASLVQRNYHLDARSSSVMDSLVAEALQTANESGHAQFAERANVTEEEARPVVGFVNQIIHDAIRMHASDIHIEPRFDHAEIRYRLDGQLMTMREVPQALVPMVVTRLKIMAELDIVEYRVPQDGRISLQFGANAIDLRVSCLPSLHGQRLVMRVLDKSFGLRRLDELGFDAENLSILRSLVEKPYGLFLSTGPTGSGKTTTLYAAIQEIRQEGMNIMTCEDPVEYDLEGVNQSQVNERVGLTFAEQLRAILRQDPDIVLVGEVRDHETAETAVRAAMTGHMVMSTLHCNDAPSAIARLLDLGIDPFLLSTSLIGTMSQRLVRRLCPHCRREEPPTADETEMMEKHFGVHGVDRIWQATGCDKCHKTGYKGRVAVSEIMPVVEEIAALIAARAPLEQIKSAASMYGYLPMQSDAMVRVARGETSLEEARRTVFFDTIQRRPAPRQIAV